MKNTKLLNILLLSATFVTILVGCGQTNNTTTPNVNPTTSQVADGTSQPTKKDFAVTFFYGLDYSKKLEKTSYNGAKVSLTNSQIASFAVPGYRITGYSTDAWKYNGITSDLDVYVQYAELDKFTVTFNNPNGSKISSVAVREGDSVESKDIPSYREVSTTAGYYFSGWDNLSLAENVTGNVTITATEKKADGFIPKVQNKVAVDGVKDNDYVLIQNLAHFVNGKATADWTKDAKGLDASLYACWDGDYIYYYVEVIDSSVVSFGEAYYKNFDNHWLGDKVELWSSINETYEMLSIDSLGHAARKHTFADYIQENNLFATKLIGDDITNYKNNNNPVVTNATGYTVEIAFPAYTPTDKNIENCDKLISQDFLHLSLQVNSADTIDETMIDRAVNGGDDVDKTTVGQIWTGKQIGNQAALADENNVYSMILE